MAFLGHFRIDLHDGDQFCADPALGLIKGFALHHFRLPGKIGDLINWTNIWGRIAMAIQAPRHRLTFVMINHIHLVHSAVATHTGDAAVNVDGVVKVNVIRSFVDLHPFHWFPGGPRLVEWCKDWIVLLDLRMAAHTHLRGGHIRVRCYFHKAVAVAAVHPQLARMDFVRERDGLNGLIPHACVKRRGVIPDAQRAGPTESQ